MENQIIETAKNAVKHWYLSLILGILFILVGIWVFRTPVESYIALSVIFSVTCFVSGIFETIYSVANRKELHNWGWILAVGIIDLLLGFWLISSPLVSMALLPLFAGFMLIFLSMTAMGFAFDLKTFAMKGWGWLLALGILGVIFSFILFWNPLFAGLTIVVYTGCAFITIGVFRIILSFKLKQLGQTTKAH
jgi:uncharacterized membrane protein HdeD (DUF308 family)